MIRCNAAFGCRVEEKYTSAECGVSADENVVAMERGETATFRMCASEGWEDGVFAKVRLGVSTEILRSPVEFLTGKDNQPIGFPQPLLTNLANVGKKTAAPVTMGLTLVEDHTNNYFGGLVDKDPLKALPLLGRCVRGRPSRSGFLRRQCISQQYNFPCYQLLLKPLSSLKISRNSTFTIFGMLEAWGGAFGLVFGIIGMATFWIEECLACRPQPASHK